MGIKGARGLRIGITIGLHAPDESLWINGIKQNALYLAKLFQGSPLRHNVMLVNTTGVPITPSLPWDLERFPVRTFEAVKDDLDVLIELGGQISADQTAHLKTRGTKLVSYCCGPEYVQMSEAMIFARRMCDEPFINQQYDEIWVIPQVMETSAGFFSVLRRRPVRPVPFVWDPMCLEERTRALPFAGQYRPRNAPARISIMEPNIDVLKFCLYPLLIAESAYRAASASIEYVHVTNAGHLARGCPEFIGIAHYLDLVRNSRVSFVDRHDTPQFLAGHTDIVVSHQWGLPLNYFYFDVCWNGYALVHNAHLCRGLGYYYEGSNVEEGTRQLLLAIDEHPRQWEQYRSRQRQTIRPFLATHEPLIEAYDRLLFALLTGQHAS